MIVVKRINTTSVLFLPDDVNIVGVFSDMEKVKELIPLEWEKHPHRNEYEAKEEKHISLHAEEYNLDDVEIY